MRLVKSPDEIVLLERAAAIAAAAHRDAQRLAKPGQAVHVVERDDQGRAARVAGLAETRARLDLGNQRRHDLRRRPRDLALIAGQPEQP